VCLTSKKAQSALNEYLCSHSELHDEIEKRTSTVHGTEDDHEKGNDFNDDTDVPSSAVIRDQLGIVISEGDSDARASNCVVQTRKDRDHGGLVAADDEEDVWAWNNGEKWGDEPPMTDDDS
jgi:hypothetical protein